MRRTRQWWPVVALIATTSAHGAVVRHLTLKDLAALSGAVVQGRVTEVRPQWVKGRIFRAVTVEATRVFKGAVKSGQPVRVWAAGGEVGDIGQWVPGSPSFDVGEEPLLFLEARPMGWVVTGMGWGKLRTERDPQGAEWALRDPEDDLAAPGLRVTIEAFERTVRGGP